MSMTEFVKYEQEIIRLKDEVRELKAENEKAYALHKIELDRAVKYENEITSLNLKQVALESQLKDAREVIERCERFSPVARAYLASTSKPIDLSIVLDDHDDSSEPKPKQYWIDPLYKNGHANVVYDVRSDSCIHVIEYYALAEKDAEIMLLKLALEKAKEQRDILGDYAWESVHKTTPECDPDVLNDEITSILTGESK